MMRERSQPFEDFHGDHLTAAAEEEKDAAHSGDQDDGQRAGSERDPGEANMAFRSWADEVEDEEGSMKLNLSLASWLFLLFLGGISIYLVVRNPSDILLLPGFFLPPILVLYIFYFRRLRQEISLDVVVANFACGFLPGAIVVVIVEALLALSLFLFFFSDQLQGWLNRYGEIASEAGEAEGFGARRAEQQMDLIAQMEEHYRVTIKRNVALYLFIAAFAYVCAAGTEETMKYLIPQRFQRVKRSRSHYIYMVCCLSTALGFSTSENIGYTLQARQGTGVVQGLSDRAFTAYSRAVVAIAAHGLCGGLVGAGLTDKHVLGKDSGYLAMIFPPVLVHGTFDFQQLLLMAFVPDEVVQTVAAAILDFIVLAAAAAYLWIRVSKMDLQMYGEGRVRGARQVPMVDFAVIGRGGRGRGGGDSERGGSERDDVGLLTDSAV